MGQIKCDENTKTVKSRYFWAKVKHDYAWSIIEVVAQFAITHYVEINNALEAQTLMKSELAVIGPEIFPPN